MGGIGPRDPSKDSVFQTAYESGREYFRIRQEKQQRQFAEEEAANARFSAQEQHHPDSAAPSSSSSSSLAAAAVKIPIFKSLVLYFDGVQTGHHELRQLALSYGCSIRDFYTSSVTHIIADSMTLFKAEVWGKKAVRIVKPTWIHACIERGRVVDWTQHRLFNNLLDHAADGAKPSQMGIKQFTAKASNNTTSSNISSTSASSPQPLPPPSPSQSRPMMHPPPSRIVDTNAPNFVSNYFETSRLHHISTWKNDLKQYVADSLQQQHQQHSHTFDDGSNFANFNKNNKKQQQLQTLFHVDMDCFFASVALLDRPQYANSPVAIAHSTNIGKQQLQSSSYSSSSSSHLKDSTSEIASCNYVARGFGLRNGMMLSKALALCPKLNVLPYEFDKINRVSLKLYDVLMEYTPLLQVCSCDEAIIDVTKLLPPLLRNGGGFGGGGGGGMSLFTASSSSAPDAAATATTSSLEAHRNEAILLANQIRIDIFEATGGCSASVGISHNILLTRIATKRAKPNGVFYIPAHSPDFVFGLLDDRPVDELPGVGRTLKTRLRDEAGGVETVGQLRGKRLDSLQSQFGTKTGLMLYNFSRGIDTRSLQLAGAVVEPGSTPNSSSSTAASSTLRNSISAEVNWGIRFDDSFQQVVEFLEKLSLEVAARMKRAGGYTASGICIKLKRRSEGQGEARKLMGHGICDNMSKSKSLDEPISSAEHIHSEAVKLMHDLKCPPMDVRGLGIQMTRLEIMSQNASSSASRQRSLKTMLSEMQQKSSTAKSKTTAVVDVPPSLASPSTLSSPSGNLFPPPDSQIDPEAWKNLPDEIRLEYADARSALVQQRRMLKGKGKATEPFSDTIDDENNIINNYNSSFEIHNFQDTVDNQDDGGFGITSSQLDMETLGELPEEFQRQVLADVSRRRGSTSTAATSVTAATVAAAVIKEKDTRAIMPTTLDDLDMSAFEQMPKNIQQDVMQQMGGKDGGHGGKTTDGVNVTPSKRKRVAFDNISPRLESEDYNPDSITFSQIDSSVLDALPPEIRSEVTRNVKRNVIKAKTATASKKSPLKPSPSGVRRIDHIFSNNDNNGNPAPQLSYSSSSIDGRIIPLITGPPLFNNELISFELVEQAVGDWVRSCMSSDGTTFISPPLSDDKDAISSYIADLEQAMFFTEAAVLVSKLSRLLSTVMDVDTGGTTFKPLWREFIDSLLANKNYLH